MSSPDLSKNTPVNIGLYYYEITQDIFKDPRFIELQHLLAEPQNLNRYIYSLYTDTNLLASNIFIPIFHSIYLASGTINLVLDSEKDLWLVEAFPNNKYFYLGENSEIAQCPKVKLIKSLTELGKTV